MAGIFEWASSSLGALKDSVFNTIIPQAEPVPVPQLSSKRPPNKAGNKQNKKKKKPARKTARPNQGDNDSDDQDPTIATPKAVDDQAAAAGDRPTAEESPAKKQVEESASEEEEEGSEQDTAPSPAEIARQEKSRKLAAARKEKAKAKKALLATSVVREMPADQLEADRKKIYTELQAQFKAVPTLDTSNPAAVRMHFQEVQKALESFVATVEGTLKEFGRKVPKCDVREKSASQLRQDIQKIEFSENRDDLLMARKIEELTALISQENHRVFAQRLNKMKDEAENRMNTNRQVLAKAVDSENRDRVVVRLRTLYEMAHSEEEVEAADLVQRTLDLSAASGSALFQPFNLLRKLERKFLVIGEQPNRQAALERRGPSRSITIWGTESNVEKAVEYIQQVDAAGLQKRTFDRKLFGAIIGRGGAGLLRLEELSGCFLAVDGQTEAQVVAYGPPDACEIAFEAIEKLKTEAPTEAAAVVTDLPIDPVVGRALQALHRAKVQNVEIDSKSRLTILVNPSDGTSPRILIRTRPELMDKARAMVKAELIDAYVHLTFDGPQRAVTRLLVPPRNASETAQSRILHNEFRALRDALALFVDRIGGRPQRGEDGNLPPISDDGPSGLEVVCHKMDEEQVKTKVPDLLQRASYNIARIPIEREQLRIFTPDNRALIEASSQCRLAVNASQQGAFLNLMGLDEAIEAGKKVVSEILEREGKVVRHPIEDPEVINQLLRDRAAKLRSIEQEHNVSISIFRETNDASLVGDEESLRLAIEAIQAMVDERKARKANTETLEMVVEASKLPRIIGRQGATINDIRRTSEVDNIHIPQRDRNSPNDDEDVTITITGLKDSVQVAQKMIERILNISRPERSPRGGNQDEEPQDVASPRLGGGPPSRRQRGRGRATVPRDEMPGAPSAPSRAAYGGRMRQNPGDFSKYDDADFPTIEAASGMKSPALPVPAQEQFEDASAAVDRLDDEDIDKEEVEIQAFED